MERIDTLVSFLEGTKSGSIPVDHKVLRQVATICGQLPGRDDATFNPEFLSEYNDSMLVTYLATLTKTAYQLQDLLSKTALTAKRRHMMGGGGGIGGPYGGLSFGM
eukprot:Plantae.Rhodophyta-Rhodochaete_pulchella.ctg56162.p2 GENE.Plantae.Rhodophyta-Rhodochaete_pulchella.ctg56162~~Plantae.Rhodophyta-Rhodochaete_pulchella.ctg56162.p2  ORF type:complete len:119 (+),score=10.57 Plantae.Rhodophyta-Rhodochaete_pulchella.ctg56162:40-357(+)